MCCGEVDLDDAALCVGMSKDWYGELVSDLIALEIDGVITRRDGRVSVTEKGAPVIRVVASVFDAYLVANTARHALAV
jgi:oxygen-independent coproporphyrinogen-3 oxidase